MPMKAVSVLERLARNVRQKRPGAINLMAREGHVEDLEQCYALYGSFRRPYSEAYCRVLPEMWRILLSSDRMHLFLVENRTAPPGSRIASFSITVVVNDEFCREAQSTIPPYLGTELARCYLGRELPVLNREQVAKANARVGLNVITCFSGRKPYEISREQALGLREKQAEAFRLAHSGYRFKEFLADAIGKEELQWMLDSGARLRRDYSRYFRKHRALIPVTSERPHLVGLTKEEAFANPGSYLSSFFVYTPPRFHFNHSEQSLLQRALMGETSEDLASSLFISRWTVKKRWRAIYQRVEDADCELLLPPVADSLHVTSRGAEHRRRLLCYLRQHPEELRPSRQSRRKTAW
jgi:DNA-binding CsgD family transcriptional regulator